MTLFFPGFFFDIPLWFETDLNGTHVVHTHTHTHTHTHEHAHLCTRLHTLLIFQRHRCAVHFIKLQRLIESATEKEKKRTEWRSRCSFNITVYLMQHLQSLKTEEWEQGDECKDGRTKERRWRNGPVSSFLKGHKSLLHTVTTRRWQRSLIASLSEECDRTLNHNWVYSEPEKMAGGGSEGGGGGGQTKEKENQSDCPFSPPTSRNGFVIPQLPSLNCHTLKYIFKFILNLIHLFPRPLRCSISAGYETTHGR